MPISKYFSGHGKEVLKSMKEKYGGKKGEQVFYATANKRGETPAEDIMGGRQQHTPKYDPGWRSMSESDLRKAAQAKGYKDRYTAQEIQQALSQGRHDLSATMVTKNWQALKGWAQQNMDRKTADSGADFRTRMHAALDRMLDARLAGVAGAEDSDFKESGHPRDNTGKFASGGGGGGAKKTSSTPNNTREFPFYTTKQLKEVLGQGGNSAWQEALKKEIAARESGASKAYKGFRKDAPKDAPKESKYHPYQLKRAAETGREPWSIQIPEHLKNK